MSPFATDLEAMQYAIERMSGFEAELGERLDEVDGRAIRLQASWSGVAASDYGDAHRRWRVAAREMHTALAQLRRIAATAQANYAAAIAANRSMWP